VFAGALRRCVSPGGVPLLACPGVFAGGVALVLIGVVTHNMRNAGALGLAAGLRCCVWRAARRHSLFTMAASAAVKLPLHVYDPEAAERALVKGDLEGLRLAMNRSGGSAVARAHGGWLLLCAADRSEWSCFMELVAMGYRPVGEDRRECDMIIGRELPEHVWQALARHGWPTTDQMRRAGGVLVVQPRPFCPSRRALAAVRAGDWARVEELAREGRVPSGEERNQCDVAIGLALDTERIMALRALGWAPSSFTLAGFAAKRGKEEVVRMLGELGGSVPLDDALHMAVCNRNMEVAQLLLGLGAVIQSRTLRWAVSRLDLRDADFLLGQAPYLCTGLMVKEAVGCGAPKRATDHMRKWVTRRKQERRAADRAAEAERMRIAAELGLKCDAHNAWLDMEDDAEHAALAPCPATCDLLLALAKAGADAAAAEARGGSAAAAGGSGSGGSPSRKRRRSGERA
jgi:hypothetical protein